MRSKAPLAMMEQMVMLLVFALAAALCLQAFVKSDEMSKRSEARDRAATLCQNVAEAVRHNGGDLEAALERVAGAAPSQRDGFGFFIPYDEDWNVITYDGRPQSGRYTLRAVELDSGIEGLGKAGVEAFVWNNGTMESLFAIEIAWQEVDAHG